MRLERSFLFLEPLFSFSECEGEPKGTWSLDSVELSLLVSPERGELTLAGLRRERRKQVTRSTGALGRFISDQCRKVIKI